MTPEFESKLMDYFRENVRELFVKADDQRTATQEMAGDVRVLTEKVDRTLSTVIEHLSEHKQSDKTRGARIWGVTSRIIIAAILATGGFVAAHLHF